MYSPTSPQLRPALRTSIALAHERGGLPLAESPLPVHQQWPVLEAFVAHCQTGGAGLGARHLEGFEEMLRACVTVVWCESKTGVGDHLTTAEQDAYAGARGVVPADALHPLTSAARDWAQQTQILKHDATLGIWLMNLLTAAVSARAAEAPVVAAPKDASLIRVEVRDDLPAPDRLAAVCPLPPKDVGRRNFVPPADWTQLCRKLGFGWRTGNTPTSVYGWTGSWALTYGVTDRASMGWYLCGAEDHALLLSDGYRSHSAHIPDDPDGGAAGQDEVVAGAMDIDLQDYVHNLHNAHPDTGLAMDVPADLWWLGNGYNCAGPGYIYHGRADFPAEVAEMSLSVWAAGSYDIPYDCAYGNVLTHARYLIGRLDSLGAERDIAYQSMAGCLLRNTIEVLTGRDTASGTGATLNWCLWGLVIPRYSHGALLAGAAHQVDRSTLADLCATAPHGLHLPSQQAWQGACRGDSDTCADCPPRPLADLLRDTGHTPASLVTARRVPLHADLVARVHPDDVDWPTVELFDRWIQGCLDLARTGDHAAIPALDHDGNDVLVGLMRLALSQRHKVPATVALCVLLSMAEQRNVSRLLAILNARSSTTTAATGHNPEEVP